MTRHSTRGILPLLAAASLLLTACSDDTSDTTQAESSTTPSTSATDGTTDVGPPWTYLAGEPDDVPLAAGAYGLTANGVSDQVVVIQAPEGYQNSGGWTFTTGEPFHAMGFMTADRVPTHAAPRGTTSSTRRWTLDLRWRTWPTPWSPRSGP